MPTSLSFTWLSNSFEYRVLSSPYKAATCSFRSKSVTPSRIRENLDVLGFTLTADDMAALATLDEGLRTGPDPDTLN